MRPVNLIPVDQRRAHGPSRTGPLAYVFVGALALLLAGVVVIVLSSNQISERESQLEALQARKTAVDARAAKLAPYSKFQQVRRDRSSTVYELANSRFDWPRVLRQLSLIVPKYVVLAKLNGAAGPASEAGGEGAGGGDLVSEIKGPSLALSGCAMNQKRVAALVAALHQIDGVTRVGLSNSVHADDESGSSGGSEGCNQVSFNIAVAFDAAPVSPDFQGAVELSPEEVPAESPSSESSSEAGSTTTSTASNGSTTSVSKTTTVNPPSP